MSKFRIRIELEIEIVDEAEFKAEAREILTRHAEQNGPVTISGAPDLTSPDVAIHEYVEKFPRSVATTVVGTRVVDAIKRIESAQTIGDIRVSHVDDED